MSEKRSPGERGERAEGKSAPQLSPETLPRNSASRGHGREHREELYPHVSSSSRLVQPRSPTLPLAVARHHHHGKEEATSSESPSPERVSSAAVFHHHGGGKKRGGEGGKERGRERECVYDGHQTRSSRSR